MQDFERFDRPVAITGGRECGLSRLPRGARHWPRRPLGQDIGRAHCTKIIDQAREPLVSYPNAVDVDHRVREPCARQQSREHRRLDPRVNVRNRDTLHLVGCAHRRSQLRHGLSAGHRTEEQTVGRKREPNARERLRQIVDGIERADRETKPVLAGLGIEPIFDDRGAAGCLGEARPRIGNMDLFGERAEPTRPVGVGTADQQR